MSNEVDFGMMGPDQWRNGFIFGLLYSTALQLYGPTCDHASSTNSLARSMDSRPEDAAWLRKVRLCVYFYVPNGFKQGQ